MSATETGGPLTCTREQRGEDAGAVLSTELMPTRIWSGHARLAPRGAVSVHTLPGWSVQTLSPHPCPTPIGHVIKAENLGQECGRLTGAQRKTLALTLD
jgi:hypothetical protein